VVKRLRPHPGHRSELRQFDVQPGVRILAFWKVVVNGTGPGMVCVVAEDEVLRFDCFGKRDGHYHIHPAAESVIYSAASYRLRSLSLPRPQHW